MARLEWAVNRALHAPDAEPLDASRLQALGEAERARVSFVPHPSVSLVDADHHNIRVALERLLAERMGELGLRLAASLGRYWFLAGRIHEGRAWLERFRALVADELTADLAANTAVWLGRTPREIDVLTRIAGGDSNQELAAVLFVSVATVERHIANLYRKIGVKRRSQAVQYAFQHGYAG